VYLLKLSIFLKIARIGNSEKRENIFRLHKMDEPARKNEEKLRFHGNLLVRESVPGEGQSASSQEFWLPRGPLGSFSRFGNPLAD
jgi:hypothetical protein